MPAFDSKGGKTMQMERVSGARQGNSGWIGFVL